MALITQWVHSHESLFQLDYCHFEIFLVSLFESSRMIIYALNEISHVPGNHGKHGRCIQLFLACCLLQEYLDRWLTGCPSDLELNKNVVEKRGFLPSFHCVSPRKLPVLAPHRIFV